MTDHVDNRSSLVQSLREELFGPSPQGSEIDCSIDVALQEFSEAFGPYRQKGSGEEILFRDPPMKRYGVGVLYPKGMSREDAEPSVTALSEETDEESEPIGDEEGSVLTCQAAKDIAAIDRDLHVERAGEEDRGL